MDSYSAYLVVYNYNFYLFKTLIYTNLHGFNFFCANQRLSVAIINFSWVLCFLAHVFAKTFDLSGYVQRGVSRMI